ncbi:MAG: tetratricopeptide repeat-containing protein [Solirubrobacteraceae bacterium]
MVVVYAGRRAQSLEGDLDAAGLRIRRLLNSLAPTAVVGALSDGADLLVAEAALGISCHPRLDVILPTTEAVFREASVAPGWRERFDRVIQEANGRSDSDMQSLGLPDGPEAYRQANRAFLDRGAELAASGERVVALAVAREGEGDLVEDLLATARVREVPVLRIDPSVDIAQRPRVFVAMPYGRKRDPQRKIDVDCDLVYTKILVPALEDAQLRFLRADNEIDSGVILAPMIEWLAGADLLIGDLQTANFNVGWELGLRHLLRSRQTLLIRPQGTSPPFDVSMVRQVHYRSDQNGISDDATVEAWHALAPYLRAVGEPGDRSDSPVDAVMEVARQGLLSPRRAPDERSQQLREQLAAARDAAEGDLMLEVLADAQGVPQDALETLTREAGIGLMQIGRHHDARELLGPVVERDPEVRHPEAHLCYAQALYRPREAGMADYDAAEKALKRVLVKRPTQPEVRALLGALAKRRLQLRENAGEKEADLRLALDMYRHDFEQNLNAYYEGVNVVALATVLALAFGDQSEAARARELVPAVRLAAELAARSVPSDYWAVATLAECTLYESLLAVGDRPVAQAYAAAAAMRPRPAFLESTAFQLDFLESLGLPAAPLATARNALTQSTGAL